MITQMCHSNDLFFLKYKIGILSTLFTNLTLAQCLSFLFFQTGDFRGQCTSESTRRNYWRHILLIWQVYCSRSTLIQCLTACIALRFFTPNLIEISQVIPEKMSKIWNVYEIQQVNFDQKTSLSIRA